MRPKHPPTLDYSNISIDLEQVVLFITDTNKRHLLSVQLLVPFQEL